MALGRLCLKNYLARISPSLFQTARVTGALGFKADSFSSTTAADAARGGSSTEGQGGVEKGRDDGKRKEVSVSEGSAVPSPTTSRGSKRGGILPWRSGRGNKRGGILPWRNPLDLNPFNLSHGLGNALLQATENLNRLLENWSPSRLLGRVKESDKCYKLLYEVPGLSKEDLKITVEHGFLVITGEHKEEEEVDDTTTSDSEDDGYYARSVYASYDVTLPLPDDAEVEGIKAVLKDGVLTVTIPRSEEKKRDVKEVEIQ